MVVKKGNDIMIIGPANCGKTFVLKPLTYIYNLFVSPASGEFGWIGTELVFLNNLRWSNKLIPLSVFLNLLEGLLIYIQAPKIHFTEDIL